uniref:Glycosyltransferase n=1 Tax=Ignisphaera aggregans TaxID=334771 RepID=A0A7C4BCT2_9CREN
MRILFVSPSYYPSIGGIEYVVKSVAERLVKIGHEVTIVAGDRRAKEPSEEEINYVKIVRWPTWSPGGAYHFPRRRNELEQVLSEVSRGVDVVHLHSIHSVLTVHSLRIVKNRGVRVVVTPYYHGTGHTLLRRLLWVPWRRYVRNMLKGCTVHTVSKLEARLVERDFGVKAIPIENGVEEWVRDLRWEPQGYVLYSGRIERYKSIDLLAKIVKVLNERFGLGLELKVFGRGPYKERLVGVLRELRIPHEVGDFKPFEEYIKALSRAALFGLLSEKESYPQSVNEANAVGVPVVVAKPWGLNFEDRRRTLIVDLGQGVEALAEEVYEFLRKAPLEERSCVPTWSEVVSDYLRKLYGG